MKSSKISSDWFKSFFGEKYLDLYLPFLPQKRTKKEIDGLLQLLNLPDGASILDLCCGHGRHSIELAKLGYKVTGQDLSEIFIDKAIKDSKKENMEIDFIVGDMRILPVGREFDAIVNLFNSFGYLENREEDTKVIQAVSKSLKTGGIFVQEVSNVYQLVRGLKDYNAFNYEDKILYETKEFDAENGKVAVTYELFKSDSTPKEYMYHELQTYTTSELIAMHKSAGLEVINVIGSLSGKEHTINNPHVVIVSRKL